MPRRDFQTFYGRLRFFINGEWVHSASTEVFTDTDPGTGEVIAEVPVATEKEVDEAVESAYEAYLKWKDTPFRDRAALISRLRAKFDENKEWLARVLSQDHGRAIRDSRPTIERCMENIESALSILYSVYKGDYVQQLATGIDCFTLWEPVGVFLIITPGNIPMHAWTSFVPYALACGCTVVVSPSWQCPVASDAVTKMVEEAGFPPGVVNLVHIGKKFDLNYRILSNPKVAGVAFIGSSAVGKQIYDCANKFYKRSSINGNGKNYIVVAEDADVERAVDAMIRGCYGMSGQRCLGSDNVVIVGGIYSHVKERFVEVARTLKVGYGLKEETEMGPMTTLENKEKVLKFIEKGLNEGAKLILDGRNVRVEGYERGYYLGPSIFENVSPDMHIAKVESFGPVANLIKANSLDEAIEWINTKTDFGHSACIITQSGKNARKFIKECNVGNIGVNLGIPQPYAFFPLGSKKNSHYGMAKSRFDSYKLFLDPKTVTVRWT